MVLEAAARDPARLRGLVLVGPTYDPRLRLAQSAARLLRDAVREQPSLVRGITRDYLRMGPRRLLQTALAILATRCSRSCRGSRRRPSSSAGSVTRSSLQSSELVAGRLPRGRLAVVPGAAHAVHWSHPAELRRLLLDFVQELE